MSKHIHVAKSGDAVVVNFLDHKIHATIAIADLGDELYEVAARPDCRKLVLNFADVEFLSSAMFGKVLGLKKRMAAKDGCLRLCEINPNVRLMFKLTGLDRILDIRESEAEALAAE